MNISELLTNAVASHPSNPALVRGRSSLNYRQFDARVNRLANALRRLGIQPHDHVAILMTNLPQMLEAMFASFRAGCGVVPINFRLHPREYAHVIDHSESSILFTSPQFTDPVQQIRSELPGVRHWVTTGPAVMDFQSYETLLENEADDFGDVDVDPDDVAWLFYTSGTTGVPKGAMLTHGNLWGMTRRFYSDICPEFGFREVVLHAAPLSHGSGLYALPNMGHAASHIFLESSSFDPENVLQVIEAERVTNLFAAPAMIKRLVDCPALEHTDVGSLKALVYGGAPMMVEDLQQAMARFAGLVQIYGLGETPMTITYLPQRDHVSGGKRHPNQAARFGRHPSQRCRGAHCGWCGRIPAGGRDG